jgi:O-antigen/teichoic acid export membrane protein
VVARTEVLRQAPIAAPISGWRRVFGDWLVVGSTTLICHALGAVSSLLLRMLLSPAQMGIWQALKMFLSYGNYANLGISKGAAREFNIALGSGNLPAARHGLDLAFTVNTLSSLVYGALLVGVGFWIGYSDGGIWAGPWAVGLAAIGVLGVLARYVTFQVTILRTQQAFAVTSRLSILEGMLTLVACGLATWCWGLPGLYAGTLIVLLGSLAFLRRHASIALNWAWQSAEIRRLIGIGAPILLAGAVSSLFRSLDKWMILAYLSDREFQLGCYSLALMITTQLYGLGNMLAMVTGPRYGEKFGQSGDRRVVAGLAARASELQAAAMVLPAALAIVAAPPLLAGLLPDYRTGLPPLMWLVPGVVAMTLSLPGSQYLIAVGQQRRALAAVLVATIVAAVGNHFALRADFGLMGVAAATAAGYLIYFAVVVGVSFWKELDHPARWRYLAMLALALGPTAATVLALEWYWPTRTIDWSLIAAKAVAVLLVWALSLTTGWHHGGWREQLSGRWPSHN